MRSDSVSDAAAAPQARPRERDIALYLLALAGPMIATNISRTVMSFVDFIMVSHLGTDAQAAILPASLTVFSTIAFGLGMVAAVNTLVSQTLGRGRLADCSTYGWQGLYLSLGIGMALLPAWLLVEPLFTWLDHGPRVVAMEIVYTQIGLLGIGPTIAAAALSNFFTGIHRPAIGFVAALVSNIFNAIANYALIFGHFGFAPMGIEGAAWATLAAGLLQLLILLGWMMLPRYGRAYGTWRTWRASTRHMRQLLRVGLPTGAHFGADMISWWAFTVILIGRFGKIELAANNICFKFLEVAFMPAVGLGFALTAAVGRSIGEGRPDIARRYVAWALRFMVAYMGLIGLMMAVFRHELPALLTDSDQVVSAAVPLMIFCAIFQAGDAVSITFNRALHGAGDTFWPAVLFVLSVTVVQLGGGWVMATLMPQWKSIGPWLAATVHLFLMGAILWARFRFGPWERIKL